MLVNTETRRKRRSLVVTPELGFGNTEVTFTTIFDPLEPGKGSKSLRGGNAAVGMRRQECSDGGETTQQKRSA